MPRRSKKNLFRRGGTQRYNKAILRDTKKTRQSSLIDFQRIPLYALFIIFSSVALSILVIPNIPIFEVSSIIISTISNIINNITRTLVLTWSSLNFELSRIALPTFTLPNISLHIPEIHIPTFPDVEISKISSNTTEVLSEYYLHAYNNIISHNPLPRLLYIVHLLKLSTIYAVYSTLWTIEKAKEVMMFLNPQPFLLLLTEYFLNGLNITTQLAYDVAKFINPLPSIKTMWDIQIAIASGIGSLFIFIGKIGLSTAYFIFQATINVITAIVGFFGLILTSILAIIYQFILGIFGLGAQFFQLLSAKLYAFWKLIEPYTNFVSDTLANTFSGFNDSAIAIKTSTSRIIEQYNTYHPK